jgi:RNA polymerase sigma factor (sigma-70 family)
VAKIMGHVRHFPQREQDIIALKFDAELTNVQISEIMNLSESNVRVILCRTLQKLRKALQEEG